MKPVLLAFLGALVLVPTLSSLRPAPVLPVQQSGQPGPPLIPLDILANHSALSAIPMTGVEWTNIETWSINNEAVNLGGNNSDHDVIALASALRWKRTNDITYREKARDYVSDVITTFAFVAPPTRHPTIDVLAVGRNALSYVLAADLISLEQFDPVLEVEFQQWLDEITTQIWSCGRTLRGIHELRPNNEGLVAGASRIAIAMYQNDAAALQDIKDAKKVFHAWVGNTAQHSGFEFGGGNPPPPRQLAAHLRPKPVSRHRRGWRNAHGAR